MNEVFRTAFNLNPLPMAIISVTEGKFIEANQEFYENTGLTPEKIPEMNANDPSFWLNSDDFTNLKKLITTNRYVKNHEITIQAGGMVRNLLFSAAVIWWNDEPCVLLVVNDVTELMLYKKEVSQMDRLNLVGEIAAGIAHEIRNPMTTVKGFLQMMQSNEKYQDDSMFLDLMVEEIDRGNDIIGEFLSLVKKRPAILELEDINERLTRLLPLLQAEANKKDIQILLEQGDIPPIMFDEAEIRQLVLNLVINGMDAMAGGGTLTIRTAGGPNRVDLAVEDQGTGIPADVVAQLGKPFFTTKEKGTGMGLAVCRRIVEHHNATMKFDTGPTGTTFTVSFPLPVDGKT